MYTIMPKKAYALTNYTEKKMLDFNILIASNTYTNYSSLIIVLPIQIKKATDASADIDATSIIVNNNFYVHWLKEVDIKHYPDDVRILPTNNTVDIYRYSEKMLKNLPAKASDTIKETLLYDKTKFIISGGWDRKSNTSTTVADRTDVNLGSRQTEFSTLISQKLFYKILLKYFVDLGLVNLPEKPDTKFIFTLESNMNKLFESNAKVGTIPASPDAQIIYHDTPYFSYPQITMDENFQVYFNAILRSKRTLRTGVRFSPYQQSFEVNISTQTINVNFQGANRQFAWLEISLIYDKSDQHQTMDDSCVAE